jgi:cysteine-rich repeat protein
MRGFRFVVGWMLAAALGVPLGAAQVAAAAEVCNDGIDNDGDGLIDGNDPDCRDDLLLFPIASDAPTDFDVSDPAAFALLTKGPHYTFDVQFTGSSFDNAAGERLPFSASVHFFGLPGGEAPPPGAKFLLVFTSLREGPFTNPSAPLPPRANAGYLLDSFVGLADPPLFVRDGAPGQVTDAEGTVFLAVGLPAIEGALHEFDFELMLVAPLVDPANLQLFNTAFGILTCGNGSMDPGEQCDDGNRLGGDCCSATCQLESNGSPCDDGSLCTQLDACSEGSCAGLPVDCADGNLCTGDLCDSAAGCLNPPVPNGTLCDDDLFCTTGDLCTDGLCGGATQTDCSVLNGPCTVGICNESANACIPQPANEGSPCDDGLFCTTGESCGSGVCGGGGLTDCSGLDNACNQGVCSESASSCVRQAANEGSTCDDGLFCTTGETCTNGSCNGGASRDCSSLEGPCIRGVCNETTRSCESQPANEGSACDDGQFCTTGETCNGGVCGGGAPTDCSTLNGPCTIGVCDEAGSRCLAGSVNEGLPCNDGQFCTTGETCRSGSCAGGAPTDCSGINSQCTMGVCSESSDSCTAMPANDGGLCDDTLFCTTGETCLSGCVQRWPLR